MGDHYLSLIKTMTSLELWPSKNNFISEVKKWLPACAFCGIWSLNPTRGFAKYPLQSFCHWAPYFSGQFCVKTRHVLGTVLVYLGSFLFCIPTIEDYGAINRMLAQCHFWSNRNMVLRPAHSCQGYAQLILEGWLHTGPMRLARQCEHKSDLIWYRT
jgi:hypothetical protein